MIAIAAVAAAATAGVGAIAFGGAAAGTAGAGTAVGAGTAGAGTAGAASGSLIADTLTNRILVGLFQGALSETIKFAGTQLTNALIPPPATPAVRLSSTPQSYTVSGGANSAAAFSVIPKIYGARRIFPQYAASPYTELVGHDQYLRMLFLLGYGPLDISQIQIGDTAIEDYEDVEWELRAGFTDDAPSRLYPGSVAESDINIQLSKSNVGSAPTVYGWSVTQTSGPLADELSVDISFPGGLVAFSSLTGSPIHIQCTWQIQWAPSGTTNWTQEPDIIIKSTGRGTTAAGHVWRVQRGQYDVQMRVKAFAINGNDWTQGYSADSYWTVFRTIRDQAPYTMAGLSVLAVRIRASRQISGVINNLNCVASSIVQDFNPVTGLWNDRAGGWNYDYDNAGAGASLYNLDSANALTTSATTDSRFIPDSVIGTGDGSTLAFSNTLPVPPPPSPLAPGDLTYSVQPGSLIISVGTQASVTDSPGTKKKTAAVASLLFISDDGQGHIVGPPGPGGATGTINYTTGAISITFTTAPPTGLNITCDFTLLVATVGAGNALAIQTASSSDQAAVASKSIPVKIYKVDGSTGKPKPTIYNISGWYKASAALTAGVTIRVFWGDTENFAAIDAIGYVDILSAGNATTSWQQAIGTVQPPSGKSAPIWMRVAVYHLAAGSDVTVYFDDFTVTPNEQGVTAVNELPNPSFDFAGQITSNPASHYRDVLESRANKLAVTDSRLDLTGLQNWWIDNNTNNRNFNAILDGPSTVFETLRKIVPFGRSSFTMRDSLYSIVEDKPQTTPIQHFTPRNSWGFKWTKAFPNLPQALKARFVNPGNNWEIDEIVVYDDNPADGTYNATTTSLYEVLDLSDGCTDYVQAWKDARYHQAQARLRGETFEWHADIENIVCQHGDLVYLTHDVPEFGRGSGRITSVQLDGSGNCTGITTDELFTFDYGETYVVRVRRTVDGTSLLETLNNPAAALGGTVDSTVTGVWALASLVITGADGPPALRSSVLGPTGTSTSAVVTMPTGMEAGDLIIVQLTFLGDPGTITPAAGWGLLLLQSDGTDNAIYEAILYKLANESEPTSYTFTWDNSVAYQSGAAAFSGVAGDQPIESNAATGAMSATSASTPVVAPLAPLNALIAVFAVQDSTGSLTLAGTTQLWAPATGLGAWYYAPSSVATGVLTFQTPIPSTSPQPSAGDLVMFGILNAEMNPVLITKIEPSHDLSARITAVDYAPDIYNADSGSPVFNSQGQAAPTRPVPQIATVNSSDFFGPRDADGSIEVRIMIALKPVPTMVPDAGSILGIEYELQTNSTQGLNDLGAYNASTTYNIFDAVTYGGQIWFAIVNGFAGITPGTDPSVWSALAVQGLNNRGAYDSTATYNTSDMVEYGGQFWVAIVNGVIGVAPGTNGDDWTIVTESTPWTAPAEVPASSLVIVTGVESGFSYNIQLRYVFIDGSRGSWSQVIHTVAGQTTPPLDVTNLAATPVSLRAVKLKWTKSTAPNLREYEVRQGSSWSTAIVVANVRTTHFEDHDLALGTYTFWVGTIDTSGNYGTNPANVTVTIGENQGTSTLDDLTDGATYARVASVNSSHQATTSSIAPNAVNAGGLAQAAGPIAIAANSTTRSAGPINATFQDSNGNIQQAVGGTQGVFAGVNRTSAIAGALAYFTSISGGATPAIPVTVDNISGASAVAWGASQAYIQVPVGTELLPGPPTQADGTTAFDFTAPQYDGPAMLLAFVFNTAGGLTAPGGWTAVGSIPSSPGIFIYSLTDSSGQSTGKTFRWTAGAAQSAVGLIVALPGATSTLGANYSTGTVAKGTVGTATAPSVTPSISSNIAYVFTAFAWQPGTQFGYGANVIGGSAPPYGTTQGAQVQDGTIVWECEGAASPIGSWVSLCSTSVTINAASDFLDLTLTGRADFGAFQQLAKPQYQIIDDQSNVVASGDASVKSGLAGLLSYGGAKSTLLSRTTTAGRSGSVTYYAQAFIASNAPAGFRATYSEIALSVIDRRA